MVVLSSLIVPKHEGCGHAQPDIAGQRCAHSLECEAGQRNREVDWPKDLKTEKAVSCGQGMFLNQLCCREVAEKVTNVKAWVSLCPIFTRGSWVLLVFSVLTHFHIVSIV